MIRLWTLGTVDLRDADGREVSSVLSQPKRLALLTYLALKNPRGFQRRDELLGLFWPEHDEEHARGALNRAIYYLRRSIGSTVILSRGDDEIALADTVWCDATALRAAQSAGDYARALELYRGDFLAGFFVSNTPAVDQWLDRERAGLKTSAAQAAWALAHAEEIAGNPAAAVTRAEQAMMFAPYEESGLRRYLALLDRTGDRARAVLAYENFAARISSELDLAPAPETQALIEAIRARNVAFADERVVQTSSAIQPEPRNDVPEGQPSAAPSARPRWRPPRMLAISAGVIVLVSILIGTLLPARALDRERVAVAVFANHTGDASLDALGLQATDAITQSLIQAGLVNNVAPPERGVARKPSDDAEIVRLGRRAHARTVIVGAFYREGDSLRFNAHIVDLLRADVVWGVPPVLAPANAPGLAIEEVAQRATGAVAALLDPDFSWFPIATTPPTFAAFQEFASGTDLLRRAQFLEAFIHLDRAYALDTTFIWARMQLAAGYTGLYEMEKADSLVDAVQQRSERLTLAQRHWLDYMQAMRGENFQAAYRYIQQAAKLVPERFLRLEADQAFNINRPGAALAALEKLPPRPGISNIGYWDIVTLSRHQLGQHSRELAAALRAERENPESPYAYGMELRALAALGRIDVLQQRLDAVLTYSREAGRNVKTWQHTSLTPILMQAAEELRAHGHEDAAQHTLQTAIKWLHSRPAKEAGTQERRGELARALYLARRWDEADTMFRALQADYPEDAVNIGYVGAIAARRGDRAGAQHCLEKLEEMKRTAARTNTQTSYWQAKITALLGDKEAAVQHLFDLLGSQGRYMHPDMDWESLQTDRRFQELIKAKG